MNAVTNTGRTEDFCVFFMTSDAFWLSNQITTGLMFLSFDWQLPIFYQSNAIKDNPIVIRLNNQNGPF